MNPDHEQYIGKSPDKQVRELVEAVLGSNNASIESKEDEAFAHWDKAVSLAAQLKEQRDEPTES